MSDMATEYHIRPISFNEFLLMGDAGILSERERVELLDGRLIEMAPIGNDHMQAVRLLTALLVRCVEDRAVVDPAGSLKLGKFSASQADFMILRAPAARYARRAPEPDDVLLLIEVARTSLEYDLRVKRPAYAAAGVPTYWIVDLVHGCVVLFDQLSDGEYRRERRIERGGSLDLDFLYGCILRVDDFLP